MGSLLLSVLVFSRQGTVGLRGGLWTGLVESARGRRRHQDSGSVLFHRTAIETKVSSMVEENQEPRPLVVFGPSAVGKGTIIKTIVNKFPNDFVLSVSSTTRSPREGEKNGKHYNFISREEFERKIENGEFLEYAEVHKNLYGTTFQAIEDVMKMGKVCILDVDSQGVKSIKALKMKIGSPYYMCIAPPCINALRERIRARGSETPEQLEMRLAAAMGEISFSKEPGACDLQVVRLPLVMAEELFFSSQYQRERESHTPHSFILLFSNPNSCIVPFVLSR